MNSRSFRIIIFAASALHSIHAQAQRTVYDDEVNKANGIRSCLLPLRESFFDRINRNPPLGHCG